MAKKKTDPLAPAPVTFIDLHYRSRLVVLDGIGDVVEVLDGRVTVTDPTHIEALDGMYGFARETK